MTEDEWLASADPDPMLDHLLSQYGRGEMPPRESFTIRTPEERKAAEGLAVKMRERKLKLFACACCRRIWNVLTDERSRKAIGASEHFADRLITQRQLTVACGAAQKVSLKVLNTPGSQGPLQGAAAALVQAVQAAHEVAKSAQTIPSRAQLMTYLPSGIVNRVACCAEALGTPRLDEREQLAILLRDIFANPFRPVAIDSAWLAWNDGTVRNLAQAIYDERELPSGHLDAARLAILADALEEAGCANADILNHCRSPGPHVRGCWVLDLLLGKE